MEYDLSLLSTFGPRPFPCDSYKQTHFIPRFSHLRIDILSLFVNLNLKPSMKANSSRHMHESKPAPKEPLRRIIYHRRWEQWLANAGESKGINKKQQTSSAPTLALSNKSRAT